MSRKRRYARSRAIGDLILPFETGIIPASLADIRPQIAEQPPAMTLIYSDTAGFAKLIKAGLSRFGRTSTVVHTPLDAIFCLQDETTTIDAMVVSLHDSRLDIMVFFDFLKEEHPHVKRIAFAHHRPLKLDSISVHTCQQDMVQEVDLTILQDLPSFDRAYSPGHWIDHIVGKRIHSFSIVEPSEMLSQSIVSREKRYPRAFRDGSWSIGCRSLFMDLTSTRKVGIKERKEQPMQ